ncbi:hypothetical protein SRHO_G00197740 [Serrasalmus rhombeus]
MTWLPISFLSKCSDREIRLEGVCLELRSGTFHNTVLGYMTSMFMGTVSVCPAREQNSVLKHETTSFQPLKRT